MIPAATESEAPVSLARQDESAPPLPSAAPSPPWRFGSFLLDPARRELRRDGQQQHVEPKVLDLIAYLVRHRERVVSRDEILDELWRDEHVSDAALGYCVKAARRAIGDSGDAQHTIATVPRRGFRFVAEVNGAAQLPLVSTDPHRPEGSFVGRDRVLARLTTALAASQSGRLRVALIAGEPGIGKTRLADELCRVARVRGVGVLEGRCHEGVGTPPFWPWTQILRAAARTDARRPATNGSGDAIAILLQELGSGDGLVGEQASSADQRFRLFDALREVIERTAHERPLLVVLDDLQWADAASLLLLRFLGREMRDLPLMLVAIYRDTDVGPDHAMLACTADLVRFRGSERIELRGLSEADLAHHLLQVTGAASPALVERIHARTGGNPFFATEAVRLLHEHAEDDATRDAVPASVRDVVSRRVAALSASAQALLRVGAVLGREFELVVLQQIPDAALRRRSDLLAALDHVLAARLVERHGPDGRFRFTHDVVRETIYDALPCELRARLHEHAGRILETASGPEDRLAALAHHFDRAAFGDDPERAIAYTVRAAERAASVLAYEEAALHYERALELAAQRTPPSRRARTADRERTTCETMLLDLGESQWKSGDVPRAREAFRRAITLARANGDGALLARAALGFGGDFRGFDVLMADQELVAVLEEALSRLPSDEPSVLRGRVMARLAIALYDVPGSLERRSELSAAAVAIAETTGDRAALAAALCTRHWAIWGPDTLDERVTAATALRRLADESGDRECALHAHRFLTVDALERGDRAAMDHHLASCAALAGALRQPYYRWFGTQLQAMCALLAGRIDDSERLLEEAHEIGSRSESRNVELGYQALRFWVRREQGRVGELEPLLRAFVERLPEGTSWRAALALLYVEIDRPDAARAHLDLLAARDFAVIPRNAFWLATMVMTADACAGLYDEAHARPLHALLRPYAGRVAELSVGGGCLGSIDRPLGRLAALLGDREGAETHFADALRIERGLDAPLLVAGTERDRATARD